ncbi:MAG: SIR2 family protein [Candidatus Firestonebacteria bacterium]
MKMNNQCFLLGAGFTHAITNGEALLTNDIMPKLKDIIIPEVEEDYKKMHDIELFITSTEIKIRTENNDEKKEKLGKFIENVNEIIASLYDIDKFQNNYQLCVDFVKKVPKNACVLTTNYDCILDKYLYLNNRWYPNDGYSFTPFPSEGDKKNSDLDNIILFKLHGSCNFRDKGGEYPFVEVNNKIFPKIYADMNGRNSITDKGAHIIIMSYLKIYNNGIMLLWREAIEKLKNADQLSIIGCSLRDEDIFLKYALYHFGMKEEMNNSIIEIIDNDCMKVQEKVKRLVAYPDKHEYKLYNSLSEYLYPIKYSRGILKGSELTTTLLKDRVEERKLENK